VNRRNVGIGIAVSLAIGGVVAAVAVGSGGSAPRSSKVVAGRERAAASTSTPGSTTAATGAAPTSSSPGATTTPTSAPAQGAGSGGVATTAPPAPQGTTPATAPPTQATVATTLPPCPGQSPGDISVTSFAFTPSSLPVSTGTRVTWAFNAGCTHHTVTATNGGGFDSGSQAGGTFSFTFNSPGTYMYHCSIHSSMTGSVTVS